MKKMAFLGVVVASFLIQGFVDGAQQAEIQPPGPSLSLGKTQVAEYQLPEPRLMPGQKTV